MTPSTLTLAVGITYLIIGVVFAALPAPTHLMVVRWRLAAWVVSAVVYAAQIGYLRLRAGRSTPFTAGQAALGAAIGAFGLAVVGPARVALMEGRGGWLWVLALVLWPVITGLPAFLVAYAAAALVGRLARR